MNPRLRARALLLLVAAAIGWTLVRHGGGSAALRTDGQAAPDVLRLGSLTLEPCDIGKRGTGNPTLRAYCKGVAVPEDRSAPAGRQVLLRVAVVRAESAGAEPDLVTFLDGGPGGAATEDYPMIAGAFEAVRKRRDVLLVDQRGTGGSNALDCTQEENASGARGGSGDGPGDAGGDGNEKVSIERALQQLRQCVVRLAPHAAPQFYATRDAVEDLEAVRRALGSPRLDLVGVSYGTRLAQQYARRHPEAVRAIVLDSSVPNDLALGSEHAANLEAVLRELFARCRAERACAERYGDPYQTLERLRARLRSHPQRLTLRDPYTFRIENKVIDYGALAQLVRLYAYSPYTAALLPYVLQQADAGDFAPLLGQAQVVVGDVADSLSSGLALSVTCAEDADRLQPNPADEPTVMGNALTDWLLAACRVWPHGTRPAGYGAPLQGPVPALLLAGEHDPVTPVRYARAILRTLPRARLLELKGQGHGLLPVGCVPRLLGEFIRTLDARGLDAHCLEALGPTPFFIDANGANP